MRSSLGLGEGLPNRKFRKTKMWKKLNVFFHNFLKNESSINRIVQQKPKMALSSHKKNILFLLKFQKGSSVEKTAEKSRIVPKKSQRGFTLVSTLVFQT